MKPPHDRLRFGVPAHPIRQRVLRNQYQASNGPQRWSVDRLLTQINVAVDINYPKLEWVNMLANVANISN